MSEPAVQHQLWAALASGDSLRIRELAATGADVNLPIGNPGGETPLIRAVVSGNTVMVRLLIELGADVNQPWKGPKSWTPLMFAHESPEIVQLLIGAGADLNARTTSDWIRGPIGRFAKRPGGETALHLAAAAGNADVVRTLLRAGANVEARAEDGRAPLDYAVKLGAVNATAEALVEAGAQLTQQRLDAMHASAHRPDSDVIEFPVISETATDDPRAQGNEPAGGKPFQPPTAETAKAPPEFRCPNCHALIYSRKPKICGQCGAFLPPELLLTEPEVQALADERGWARELADKLITQSTSPPQATAHPRPNSNLDKTPAESFSPEDLLRRDSSAEQFKYRDRPAFWLYVVGYAVFFFAIGFVALKLRMMPSAGLLAMTTLFAFLCFRAWHIASPVCPNCKHNIRLCVRQYCQLCGQPLKNQRCNGCGVDYSWTAFLPPNSRRGNFGWIKFCPGCGVRLDAKVGR